jgi:hypothetical protein
MAPIHKREDQELVNVIRNAAIKLFDAEDGPNVRAALDELERRHCNQGSVLSRLARVEEDLAAFKREHATNPWGKGYATREDLEVLRKQVAQGRSTRTADHGLLPDGQVDPALVPSSAEISGMRTNAENRAWCLIEEWIESKRADGPYHVLIRSPQEPGQSWNISIVRYDVNDDAIALKQGTSRVDALAHLASWCQAEMPEESLPSPYCGHNGPCGVGVPKCVQETVSLAGVF